MLDSKANHEVFNFLHIAKCGGSSFKSALKRNHFDTIHYINGEHETRYDEQITSIVEELEKNSTHKRSLVMGHQAYGLHRMISSKVHYITLLRHPIKRVYSYYRHAADLALQRGFTPIPLEEYLEKESNWQGRNGMTRILSATGPFFESISPSNVSKEQLERAWVHLSGFYFYDLVENFDHALYRLNRQLQAPWKAYFYRTRNTRGYTSIMTEQEEQMIRERNELDVLLYERAKEALSTRPPLQSKLWMRFVQLMNQHVIASFG